MNPFSGLNFQTKHGSLPLQAPDQAAAPNPFNPDLQKLARLQGTRAEVPPEKPRPLLTPIQAINAQFILDRKLDDPSFKLSADESIALLSQCMNLGEREAQNAVGKELVVFIGNTQAGKSTLVNYLYGCEMEGKTPKELGITGFHGKLIVVKPTSPLKEIMPIGHSKKSMTFMPKIETDHQGVTYCDCPGFLDNRGFEINIANAVNVKRAFIKAKSVRVVILINHHSLLTDRARGLSDMIRICADLFGSKENLIHYKDSILLGISQLPAIPAEDEGAELEDLKKFIRETHLTDPFEVNTLQFLAERLFIYDPLNRTNLTYQGAWSRETVLRNLAELTPIEDPIKIFKTVLNAEDERGMRYICDEIKGKILSIFTHFSLYEKDYKAIAEYQKSLNTLEIIENPYALKLIGEIRAAITAEFSKMVHRFDVCCADATSQLVDDAAEILKDLKTGIVYFDSAMQAEVNVPELEKRFNALMKKKQAIAAALELQDLEKKFRDYCVNQNFTEAKFVFGTIKEKVAFFEKEFAETQIPHRINSDELNSLYDKTKRQYDEACKEEEDHRRQVEELKEQRRNQERIIEEQRRRENELQEENARQQKIARKAEKARAEQERINEEQRQREAQLQAERDKELANARAKPALDLSRYLAVPKAPEKPRKQESVDQFQAYLKTKEWNEKRDRRLEQLAKEFNEADKRARKVCAKYKVEYLGDPFNPVYAFCDSSETLSSDDE